MRISWGLVAGLGMFGLALDVFGQQPPAAVPDAVQMQIVELRARIAQYEQSVVRLSATQAAASALLATDRASLAKLCAGDPRRCAEGKK